MMICIIWQPGAVGLPRFSSVQFLDGVIGGGWGWDMMDDSAEIVFQSFLPEAIVSSFGMALFDCCPFSIFSADHGIATPSPPRCSEEWFWKGCRDT